MTKITAQALGEALLAATFETTIAKAKTFQIKLEDFPLEAAVALMQYGVGRKFNDAVGGADKDAETKVSLAQAMIDDWKAGKIGRQPREAVTDEVKMRRAVLTDLLKGNPAWDKFKAMEAAERAEALDALYAKQPDAKREKLDKAVAERIAEAAAKRAKAAELASALDF